VYESGSFEFVTNNIPKLKIGQRIGEQMLKRLNRLKANAGLKNDLSFFTDYENQMAENLVIGIRQRVNALICAMQMDELTYNRFGIKLTNSNWGTPADLKATVSTGWDNAGSATPLTDIQVMAQEHAPDTYGEQYDRITMSSKAFRYLTSTTEFQNRVSGELRYDFGATGLNVRDAGAMRELLSNIVGMEIEIYDGVFWTRQTNGAKVRERVLPANKVILSSKADDGDRTVMDFANGAVIEGLVGGLLGEGGLSGEEFGPISYYTGNPSLNPPDITAWAVMRGFPRKHREGSCHLRAIRIEEFVELG
jgi:hypothetical protein